MSDPGERADGVSADQSAARSADLMLRPRDALAGVIIRDIQTLGVALGEALADAGVDFTSNREVATLVSLRLDGPLRPRTIVDSTKFTRGGVTSMLDRMEASGLVRRVRGALADRRAVLVELTDVGVAVTDRLAEVFAGFFEISLEPMERLRRWFELGDMDPGPLPQAPDWTTERWLEFIRQITNSGSALNRAFMDIMGDDDPTPHYTYVTLWLAQHEGGTRPKDVSKLTGLTSGGTTELLDRLESRGLLERSYGVVGDHRGVLVSPTDEGRRRVAAALATIEQPLEEFGRTFFPSA